MGMISARFCVYNKQGTPNDATNVENIFKRKIYLFIL